MGIFAMKRTLSLTLIVVVLAAAGGCKMWEMFQRSPAPAVAASRVNDNNVIPYGSRMVATARHILVPTQAECERLKAELDGGADFAQVARLNSKCPSGQKGGDLGEFGRGQMAPEFDRVVFNEEPGKVHGPVKTQFGYHLIEITSREVK
jgi:peptidyl-prolyl cis-trans isomerase C